MSVPQFCHFFDESPESDFLQEASVSSNESTSRIFEKSSTRIKQFNQEELSDLIRDLNLSKEASELLASRLKEMLLMLVTKVTFYRSKVSELLSYFHTDEGLVFCSNVEEFLLKMGIHQYRPQD